MKTSVFPHMAALLVYSSLAPLGAQNLNSHQLSAGESHSNFDTGSELMTYDVPAFKKVRGEIGESKFDYVPQDALTLEASSAAAQPVDAVVDLDILRNPSAYKDMSTRSSGADLRDGENLKQGLARISATYRESGTKDSDCEVVSLSIEQRIKLDPAKLLEVVEVEVSANPGCACEIVKSAIKTSEADVPMVVSIVETAFNAAPDSMRIVSQCAIAAMPESIAAVQALLTKLDPNSGEEVYSSKSSKSSKDSKDAVDEVAAASASTLPSPLDRPPIYPPVMPPPILPPPVTEVNPGSGL